MENDFMKVANIDVGLKNILISTISLNENERPTTE